jgi:hypothetical protein
MTPPEIIAKFRAMGPQNADVFFRWLANGVYEARLSDGVRLRDAADFAAWLRELADACCPPRSYFDSDESWEASRALSLLGPWEALAK